ncbi:MAG: ribonuclease J [Mycoplasmataceae bacterium]|nr:ribonuclease J [Mycoplasmataceae bacterium]
MTKIDFFALGGIDERGKNCYVLTINGDSYIINFGLSTIPAVKLGVQWMAPDVNWIQNNRSSIKGIFIGTPDTDNAGALEFFANELANVPIYTTDFGASIIATRFVRINKQNIRVMTPMKPEKIGKVFVTPFLIFNQAPRSVGFVFTTDLGCVVYVDDFVVSSNRTITFEDEISSLTKITQHKCLALIANCSLAGESIGFTNPKHRVLNFFDKVLSDNQKATIVFGFYDSDYYRALTLISLVILRNRPICIFSKLLWQQIQFLKQKSYFNISKATFITPSDLTKHPNAIIILFESKLLLYDKIIDLLEEDNEFLKSDNSVVVFGENTVAGYERDEANMFDEIAQKDIRFYKIPQDILPTKASNEDHKQLISLLKPEHIIPVGGLYRHLCEYQKMALQCGVSKQQILLLKNGKGVSFEGEKIKQLTKTFNVDHEDHYVSASGFVGEIDNSIVERNMMKTSGVVIANIVYDKQKSTIIKHEFTLNGVVEQTPENQKVINTIIEDSNRNITNLLKSTTTLQHRETMNEIRRSICKLFEKRFDKRPLVIVILVYSSDLTN